MIYIIYLFAKKMLISSLLLRNADKKPFLHDSLCIFVYVVTCKSSSLLLTNSLLLCNADNNNFALLDIFIFV